MADNQFSNRPGESSEINERELIVRELIKEFPNDPLLQQGILSPTQTPEVKPVTDIAKRNTASGLLEVDADVSAIYAEYTLSKLLPGLDAEQLDDALDDEFTTFIINEVGGGLPVPIVSGLFFITTVPPGDYHDMYIQYGVERIPSMMASGMDEDAIQRNIFCVWYIERSKARPIPNYKTLEVMLVERNLTYDSISVATADDIIFYDLRLDGRYADYTLLDEAGNTLPPPTFIDELVVRQVIARNHEWNYKIRYLSGYRPGKTFNGSISSLGESFLRDPGDYVRPPETRVSSYNESVTDANGITYTREVLPREARQRQEIAAQLADPIVAEQYGLSNFEDAITPQTVPQLFSLLDEDPYDLYFDGAFRISRIESMRSEMEGRLVLPEWSKSSLQTAFNDAVTNGTDELRFDDLFLNLSMMVFGHFKQIQDINVLKRIATDLNIDISDYDSSLETRIEGTDILDENQFNALSDIKGIINVLYLNGAIKLLGGLTDEYWTTFAKIGNVDQLDIAEYEKYQVEYRDIFNVQELVPFEPPGSAVYYQRDTLSTNYLANLQRQAILQAQIDAIRRNLFEKLLPLQTAIDNLETALSKVPDNFLQTLQDLFGPESDVQNLLYDSTTVSDWVFNKKKNNDKIKEQGRQRGFFTLFEKEGQISRSLSRIAEDEIFSGINAPNRPLWHINAKFGGRHDDSERAAALQRFAPFYNQTPKVILLNEPMYNSLNYAGQFRLNVGSQKYQKPTIGDRDNRAEALMKDPNYFRATVANYIMSVIFHPKKWESKNVPPNYPDSILAKIGSGATNSDLITICEEVNKFIAFTAETLREAKEILLSFDTLLINANEPEELLTLLEDINNILALEAQLGTEIFAAIADVEKYIKDEHIKLFNRIVNAIEFVRERVYNKNDKYYILWPGSIQGRVLRWKPGYNFKQFQPEGT